MKSNPSLFAVLSLAAAFAVAPALAAADTVPYVVRAGDTLSAIAVRNKTTVRAILRENDIADPNRIREGQTLLLPVPAAPAPEPAEQPIPAAPVAQPAPAPASAQVVAPTPAPVAPAWVPVAADRDAPALREASFYDIWIRERLTLGLSLSYGKLTDNHRPRDMNRKQTFLGYINHLETENELTWAPTLTWLASDFVRLGLTYHSIEARTQNFPTPPQMVQTSDGNATSSGFLLTVEGSYPLEDGAWRPHAGVGLGWYKGDFDEDTWWKLGYYTAEEWKAAGGKSSGTAEGRYRYIAVDDAFGASLLLGVAWRPARNWEIDLSVRKTWLDPDCEFGYKDEKSGKRTKSLSGHFTMDSLAAVLTASWVF